MKASNSNLKKTLNDLYDALAVAILRLAQPQADSIRRYYSWFLDARYETRQWALAAEARRLEPALTVLDEGAAVLDVGCGFGLHACLFRRLGADVVGVDLDASRISAARALAPFLVSNPPRFIARSIHRALEEEHRVWRLMWVNEAISHIEPVPSFLALAANRLEPKGRLVISDHNAANPWIRWKAFRERGRALLTTKPDPEDGSPIAYARERTYTPRTMKNMLIETGLELAEFRPHGLVPLFLRRGRKAPHLMKIEDSLRRLPIARLFSGSYTIVAVRKSF